jgi:hypothetical protein
MDLGRSATARWHLELRQQQQQQQQHAPAAAPVGQRLITSFFAQQPPSPAALQRRQARQQQQLQQQLQQQQQQQQRLVTACSTAVARFWELLADFNAVATPPAAWLDPQKPSCVPLQHPFFHSVSTGGVDNAQRALVMAARLL